MIFDENKKNYCRYFYFVVDSSENKKKSPFRYKYKALQSSVIPTKNKNSMISFETLSSKSHFKAQVHLLKLELLTKTKINKFFFF